MEIYNGGTVKIALKEEDIMEKDVLAR